MKQIIFFALLLFFSCAQLSATVKVVTSTTDFKSIAEMIGGDLIAVESITKGTANPHSVEVLPSYMIKVARADLYLKVGFDLDLWAQGIIDGSRNSKLKIIDCSKGISPLERPSQKLDASRGDIHPQGNPHYWLDPENGIVIAENILEGLATVDPRNSEKYRTNKELFVSRLKEKIVDWQRRAVTLKNKEVITFHNSWPYLAEAFGITVAGFIEPFPGVEPSPSHTTSIIELVKQHQISLICHEPYFSNRSPNAIARETGAKVVVLPPSVGGVEAARDYFSLFDTILSILEQ